MFAELMLEVVRETFVTVQGLFGTVRGTFRTVQGTFGTIWGTFGSPEGVPPTISPGGSGCNDVSAVVRVSIHRGRLENLRNSRRPFCKGFLYDPHGESPTASYQRHRLGYQEALSSPPFLELAVCNFQRH